MTATLCPKPFELEQAAAAGPKTTWGDSLETLEVELEQRYMEAVTAGELELGSLRDARLRLTRPIRVILGREEGQVVASAPDFEEFGQGHNRSEAIDDLQRTLAELYFALKEDEGRLGRDLQGVWQRLQSFVVERRA